MDFTIEKSKKEDKAFVLHANKQIDIVSGISKSALCENVDQDLFCEDKAVCLVAKEGAKNAGMILFSKVYWADRGQGIYVSQAFVEEEFRHNGLFKQLLKAAFAYFENTNFVTLLVAKDNVVMQKCVEKLNFEWEDMLSFVVNVSDFM